MIPTADLMDSVGRRASDEPCKRDTLGDYWTICGAPGDGPCMCDTVVRAIPTWSIETATREIGNPYTGCHHRETTYALLVDGVTVTDEFYDIGSAETAAYYLGLPGAALPPQPAVDAAVSDLVSEVLKAA